jgi:hypothetical protein
MAKPRIGWNMSVMNNIKLNRVPNKEVFGVHAKVIHGM